MLQAAREVNTNPAFHFPGYIWITLGWYHERWWTAEVAQDPAVDCLDKELETVLPQMFGILFGNTFLQGNNVDIETDVSLVR